MSHDLTTDCIDACNACADACDRCATACLQEPDPKPMTRCVALDIDCAALCRLAAGAIARDSELARRICGLCVLACEACGEECGRHEHDHCQACAAACRACAEACRQMVAV
ncbi:four-helix bundle copper-binding protein [Pelomonas cellulosilytica]|uniref:Four-helix bundle copper-binding protein n=1 Tax=Pelomonas cellulosilytica TaxID=2906762 RepID=A0ABS8XVG1_9BURK|nr:four-helix bundle copper-binding protein [Pelomonas sp. P8]MCE4555757.1 four-helix bundle copper-binding protein [Pelomonas sp. P8]